MQWWYIPVGIGAAVAASLLALAVAAVIMAIDDWIYKRGNP